MMENVEKRIMSKKEKIMLYTSAILGLVCVVLAVAHFAYSEPEEKKEKAEFSDVQKICEWATLVCYYHNVAEYEKQPEGLLQYGYGQVGYKKFWIEYSGIVKIGIDASKVWIGDPDEAGNISVYVPDAEVLYLDSVPGSFEEMIKECGAFTTITGEDEAQAYTEAQKTMRKNAESDQAILVEAKENAKKLLENYIITVGEIVGEEYSINWISEPVNSEDREEAA